MNYVRPERVITWITWIIIQPFNLRKNNRASPATKSRSRCIWSSKEHRFHFPSPGCKNPVAECRGCLCLRLLSDLSPNPAIHAIRHRPHLKVTPSVTLKRHSQALRLLAGPFACSFTRREISDAETIILPLCRVPLLRRFTSEKRSLDSILISSRTNLFKMRTKAGLGLRPWDLPLFQIILDYPCRCSLEISLKFSKDWSRRSSMWEIMPCKYIRVFVWIPTFSLAFICPSYDNRCDFEPFTKSYSLNCKHAENIKWR